jgi:hypothetical protein
MNFHATGQWQIAVEAMPQVGGSAAPPGDVKSTRLRRHYFSIEGPRPREERRLLDPPLLLPFWQRHLPFPPGKKLPVIYPPVPRLRDYSASEVGKIDN